MCARLTAVCILCQVASNGVLHAAEPAKANCCADDPAAEKVCEKPTSVERPLTRNSLYQIAASWTNDEGNDVNLASFRGHPVVVAMIFSHCEYACPLLVSDMIRLRESLPKDAKEKTLFILVSFDSARDTPVALKAYRERMKLGDSWTLLHGETSAVQELAMILDVKYKQDARGQFSHSNVITVLTTEGEIAHQRRGLTGEIGDAGRAVKMIARLSDTPTSHSP
jgi:protein SCO1/2